MNADERAHVEATASGPGAPYAAVVVTDKPDLVAFLAARYDELEATAKAAGGRPWVYHVSRPTDVVAMRREDWARHIETGYPELAQHILRNDPEHVLADIAARRKILAEHTPVQQRGLWLESEQRYDTETVCPTCIYTGDDEDAGGNRFRYHEHAEAPCRTLCLLAAPFASHPQYDPAWATVTP